MKASVEAHQEAYYVATGIKYFQNDKKALGMLSEPFKGLMKALIDTKDIYEEFLDAVEDGKRKD